MPCRRLDEMLGFTWQAIWREYRGDLDLERDCCWIRRRRGKVEVILSIYRDVVLYTDRRWRITDGNFDTRRDITEILLPHLQFFDSSSSPSIQTTITKMTPQPDPQKEQPNTNTAPSKRKSSDTTTSQPTLQFTTRNPPWTYLKLQLYVNPTQSLQTETTRNI